MIRLRPKPPHLEGGVGKLVGFEFFGLHIGDRSRECFPSHYHLIFSNCVPIRSESPSEIRDIFYWYSKEEFRKKSVAGQ